MRRSPVIRHLLRLFCVLAVSAGSLVVASGSPVGAAPAPSPWLQDGHDAGGTDANIAETRIAKYNLDTLTSRWSVKSFDESTGRCYGGQIHPAITESHVYSVTQGVVTKQNIKDGSTVWATADPLSTTSGPEYLGVSGGRVIVELSDCNAFPQKQYVVAFDSATGRRVWSRTLDGTFSKVAVSGSSVLIDSGDTGRTTVLRVGGGSVVWSKSSADDQCGSRTPLILDGQVLSTICDSGHGDIGLRSRSLADGSLTWARSDLASYGWIAATDSPSGPHAYVSSRATHRTIDIDPRTGATRFSLIASWASGYGDLAVDGTMAYGTCDRRDQVVCAWDVATGKFRWKLDLGYQSAVQSPIVTGTLLYLGGFTTEVIKPSTGQHVARLDYQVVAAGSGHLAGYDVSGGAAFTYDFTMLATSNVA